MIDEKEVDRITEDIYNAYGSGTGVLFGISADLKASVRVIIKLVLTRQGEEIEIKNQKQGEEDNEEWKMRTKDEIEEEVRSERDYKKKNENLFNIYNEIDEEVRSKKSKKRIRSKSNNDLSDYQMGEI